MLGEAAFLVFGEDDLIVQGHLEGAAAGGEEFQALDILFVFIQHLFRQTDGFREVASRSAVFDAESLLVSHGCAPFCVVLMCRTVLPQYDSVDMLRSTRRVSANSMDEIDQAS